MERTRPSQEPQSLQMRRVVVVVVVRLTSTLLLNPETRPQEVRAAAAALATDRIWPRHTLEPTESLVRERVEEVQRTMVATAAAVEAVHLVLGLQEAPLRGEQAVMESHGTAPALEVAEREVLRLGRQRTPSSRRMRMEVVRVEPVDRAQPYWLREAMHPQTGVVAVVVVAILVVLRHREAVLVVRVSSLSPS
jgi:hypothetical protein